MSNAVIIDVREPREFLEGSMPGAINLPSSAFDAYQFQAYKDSTICLLCQTGGRSKTVLEKLQDAGFENVSVLNRHMEHFIQPKTSSSGWTVDRQFRFLVGVLIAISLTGFLIATPWMLVLAGIISAGLIVTALIGECYLRQLVAMMPWNKDRL